MAEAGAAAINAMFGAETNAAPAPGGETGAETNAATDASVGRPDWVPEAFWQKAASGDGGEVNVQGLAKSWTDTKAALTRTQQELAAAKAPWGEVPTSADKYAEGLDLDALKGRAPNLAGADDPVIGSYLRAAHKAGIPPAKAQEMLGDFFELHNEHMPAPPPPDKERLEKAKAYLGPNGDRISEDVRTWLTDRAATQSFTEEQIGILDGLVKSGPGLSTLYSLMRATMGSGPPTGAVRIDRNSEEQALRKLMASDDWQANRAEIERRWTALYGESQPIQIGG